jgi:hypothetical protein
LRVNHAQGEIGAIKPGMSIHTQFLVAHAQIFFVACISIEPKHSRMKKIDKPRAGFASFFQPYPGCLTDEGIFLSI